MSSIFLPHRNRKRALIVVDMQPGFLPEHTHWIIPNIKQVIETGNYDLYIEAIFHAQKGSIWDKQTGWVFPLESTISEIKQSLANKQTILVTKEAKSVFQGDINLVALFKEKGIEEVQIVGVDANDCVLATAFDSFDTGFPTYVIEECVESSEGGNLREAALVILRNVDLTNHSELAREAID